MKGIVKPILTLIIGIALFIIGYLIGQAPLYKIISIWLICGLPYGFARIRLWFTAKNRNLGTTIGLFVLNFILSGLLGGFIYIWTMLKSIFSIVSYSIKQKKLENND